MNKTIFLLGLLFFGLAATAQNRYHKGYIIDKKGYKTQGFVFDGGANKTPQKIRFKPSKNAGVKKFTVEDIREFGFDGFIYRNYPVKIDRSTDRLEALGNDNRPDFTNEKLFLKVLVQGEANLYRYSGKGVTRYFYNVGNDAQAEQLIYKRYRKSSSQIGKNNRFRQQIFTDMDCTGMDQLKISRLDYTKADLVSYFKDYNKCVDEDYESKRNLEDEAFALRIAPQIGARFVNADIENTNNRQSGEYDAKTTLRYGVALEFLPPTFNRKWAILIEPSYHQYKNKTTLVNKLSDFNNEGIIAETDYSSIEIPVGVRYYLFANDELRFMIDGGYLIDIPMNNEVTARFPEDNGLSLTRNNLEITSSGNLFIGVGAKYKGVGVEFRLGSNRNLLELDQWNSEYNYFQVALSYDLIEF